MAKKPQIHHSRWTSEQDIQLKNMVVGGFSSAEIANYFGRTISSIYSRKLVLGLEGRLKRSTKAQIQGSVKKFTSKPARKPKLEKVPEPKVPEPKPIQLELSLGNLPKRGRPAKPKPIQLEMSLGNLPKRGRPAKPKSEVLVKTPKTKTNGYNSYSFKLSYVNQRRQRGDIKLLAEVCEMSPGFISRVLDGWYFSEVVIGMAFSLCENRLTNHEILQDLGFNRCKKKAK